MVNQSTADDPLSTTFAALADPTRRAILARLASGECSVTELAEPFDMSMPAVSKHLRRARTGGADRARARGAVAAVPTRGGAAQGGAPTGPSATAHIWEARLDRLETYLQELKDKGGETWP